MFADVSVALGTATTDFVSVSDAAGAFVITATGIAGHATARAFELNPNPAVSLDIDELGLVINTTGAPVVLSSFEAPSFAASVAVAQLDGLFGDDLIIGIDGLPNQIFLSNVSGDFDPAGPVSSTPDATRVLVLTDLDGLNGPDLIAGNDGEVNRIYLNDGSGGFTLGQALGTSVSVVFTAETQADTTALEAALQAQLDALFATVSIDAGTVQVIAGAGDYIAFRLSEAFQALPGNEKITLVGAAALADAVQAARSGGGDMSEFITALVLTLADADATRDLLAVDTDAVPDGVADIIVVANFEEQNRVYARDASGNFGPPTLLGSADGNTTSVAVGDVDGSNGPDIVFGNLDTFNRLHLRQPGGGFDAGSDVDDPAVTADDTNRTTAVALGDINGDATWTW